MYYYYTYYPSLTQVSNFLTYQLILVTTHIHFYICISVALQFSSVPLVPFGIAQTALFVALNLFSLDDKTVFHNK